MLDKMNKNYSSKMINLTDTFNFSSATEWIKNVDDGTWHLFWYLLCLVGIFTFTDLYHKRKLEDKRNAYAKEKLRLASVYGKKSKNPDTRLTRRHSHFT